ncbi:hypothetical protein [Alteromonas gilva]|uniref:Uncharacterized protein n=1 Tax=Alteromonas gilva TaxID=2987522 RepID=A0ABT5L7G7_9ALTE|nr:hypothetical protein [Alteromonas gilva]MDC8832981.1 hypothetical protein [Alteromonas gilva]
MLTIRMAFISLLMLLNTGCAATDNLFARIANYYVQYQFNSDVADSQEKIQEARELMATRKNAPAKKALDEQAINLWSAYLELKIP